MNPISKKVLYLMQMWWLKVEVNYMTLTGTNWDCSNRGKGKGSKNSGGGKKTRCGTSSFGAEEEVHNMASSDDVGRA